MIMGLNQRLKHFNFKEKVLGQYFTPIVVSDFMVHFASLHLKNRGSACDPACGGGVFLDSMIRGGFKEIVGVDVDGQCLVELSEFIKRHAVLIEGDALQRGVHPHLRENYFDLVAGNPPFSAKYGRVADSGILSCYETGRGVRSQALEVLFLERFIQLAKIGGLIGVIIPDGILLNLNYRRLREFILNNCKVLAVISLPRLIFNSNSKTSSKASILFLKKGVSHHGEVFLAEVNSLEELPNVLESYKSGRAAKFSSWSSITFDSFHPKSYLLSGELNFRFSTFKLKDLIEEMFCGFTVYGERRRFTEEGLRFISAKTVTRLGVDFSKESRRFIKPGGFMDRVKAHVRVGDVLFVRVGVGCIGRAAVVVDEEDLGVVDDWIYVIRVGRKVSPYYLTMFLQSIYGRMQLNRVMRGVGTVTVPQRLLKEFYIPVPDIDFQESLKKEYLRMVDYRRKGDYETSERLFESMMVELEKYIKN